MMSSGPRTTKFPCDTYATGTLWISLIHSPHFKSKQMKIYLNQEVDLVAIRSPLLRYQIIGSPSGEPMFSLCRKWRKFAGHCKVT